MQRKTDNKKNVQYGEPKYKSQVDVFNRVKAVFEKSLIERDKFITCKCTDGGGR